MESVLEEKEDSISLFIRGGLKGVLFLIALIFFAILLKESILGLIFFLVLGIILSLFGDWGVTPSGGFFSFGMPNFFGLGFLAIAFFIIGGIIDLLFVGKLNVLFGGRLNEMGIQRKIFLFYSIAFLMLTVDSFTLLGLITEFNPTFLEIISYLGSTLILFIICFLLGIGEINQSKYSKWALILGGLFLLIKANPFSLFSFIIQINLFTILAHIFILSLILSVYNGIENKKKIITILFALIYFFLEILPLTGF